DITNLYIAAASFVSYIYSCIRGVKSGGEIRVRIVDRVEHILDSQRIAEVYFIDRAASKGYLQTVAGNSADTGTAVQYPQRGLRGQPREFRNVNRVACAASQRGLFDAGDCVDTRADSHAGIGQDEIGVHILDDRIDTAASPGDRISAGAYGEGVIAAAADQRVAARSSNYGSVALASL